MTPHRELRLAIPLVLVVAGVAAIRLVGDPATEERGGLTFAKGDLAAALEQGADRPGVRTLARFADADGVPCRVFLGGNASGIACRERGGWHLRVLREGVALDDPASVSRTEASLRKRAAELAPQ